MSIVEPTAGLPPRALGGVAPRFGHDSLFFSVVEGDSAAACLRNEAFRAEWSELLAACPWATAYQGLAFSDVWWSVYASEWRPLIVTARFANGRLCGLLLLAARGGSDDLVHVGGHHAEYHAWLALPKLGAAVIVGLLRELELRKHARRLRFHFLAPGAPVDWVETYSSGVAPKCIVGTHPRGLLSVSTGLQSAESLRKSSNRSKLNRLSREGPATLLVLRDAQSLRRWLPDIIAQCDVRQAAVHQSMPFRDDERKADFYLSLADAPELAHVTVLVAGDELLASHIGVISGSSVMLGLITHAPVHGRNSPGKLLLLLLTQQLASEGFEMFDLTPGGSYKDRFASQQDIVFSLDIRFCSGEAMFHSALRRASSLVRRTLPATFSSSAAHRPACHRSGCGTPMGRRLDPQLRAACDHAISALPSPFQMRVNCLADLMLLGGPSVSRGVLLRFLSQCVARLEAGFTVVTITDEHGLAHCAWLRQLENTGELGSLALSGDSPAFLLEDDAVRGTVPASVEAASLAARLLLADRLGTPEEPSQAILSTTRPEIAVSFGFVPISKTARRAWREYLGIAPQSPRNRATVEKIG